MKNLLIIAALCATASVFASPPSQSQDQSTTVSTTSSSQANGGTVGNTTASTTGNSSGNVTVGCLINCADTSQGTRDLADSSIAVAKINADAARDIAGTTQTIKNTPSIGMASLTSSNDTCMGSVSAGGSGPGFSIGLGSTYKDDNCVMLKNSRELWNMGMKGAAMALMCNDKNNAEALELTGYLCPQKKAAEKRAVGTLGSGLPGSGTVGTQSSPITHYSVK